MQSISSRPLGGLHCAEVDITHVTCLDSAFGIWGLPLCWWAQIIWLHVLHTYQNIWLLCFEYVVEERGRQKRWRLQHLCFTVTQTWKNCPCNPAARKLGCCFQAAAFCTKFWIVKPQPLIRHSLLQYYIVHCLLRKGLPDRHVFTGSSR